MRNIGVVHRNRSRPGLIRATALAALLPVALAPAARAAETRAVMTGTQVVQILDETVDWYRTLGTQQQAATQPSDLLILYANQQIADKTVALAFEIARANAELISSDTSAAKSADPVAVAQSPEQMRKQLDAQHAELQARITAAKRELATAPKGQRAALQGRIDALQGEDDLINARRNLLQNMAQFAGESDANEANTLKAHIDAIAASVPASKPASAQTSAAATQGDAGDGGASATPWSQFGIWDLAATVFRLRSKSNMIETIDRRTAQLQEVFKQISAQPRAQLGILAARGDAVAAQTGPAQAGANLRGARDQYDTLAWLYQQTSSIVIPLSKAEVLLGQYRRNLGNWHDATGRQYAEAWRALGIRVAIFAGLLLLVFALSKLWRHAVFRYIHDPRRRSRFLLLGKILVWVLVTSLVLLTFATEIGSLATFAGLITAGLAVAMQSVLVSVVGYFFLIGKYGIRVGDHVQIGSVSGEVIDLGLVRMHLMELNGPASPSPTGRVVAFANSIVFQASGGLFKQIPGINLAWHEISLKLPPGSDHTAMKVQLIAAAKGVIDDYHEDISRQTKEMQRTASSRTIAEAEPQVQLRFSAEGVEAIVRYPVELRHAAEIDERVSRELLAVISAGDSEESEGG